MQMPPSGRVPSTSLLRFLRNQLKASASLTRLPASNVQDSSRQNCRLNSSHALQKCRPTLYPTADANHASTRTTLPQRCSVHALRELGGLLAGRSMRRPHPSSICTQHIARRQFGHSARLRIHGNYRDDDILPLLGLDDSSGLGGRIVKPSNELKMRCTEFDENGNVTLVSGEFKKHELIAKYSLLPRDLRKIDSSVLPHILVRSSAILINLLHIRCLIKHNRVLVFDVYGSTDSYAQSLFMYDLEGKLRQKQTSLTAGGPLPYEFRALEAVLISVTNGLESEFEGVREPVIQVLRELEEDIDRDKLRHLLIYSKKLSTFEQKARLVRNAIDDLLEADDDLAKMYLTEKAEGKERDEEEHEEIELLLESYDKVADEILQVSSNLVSSIKNTEEIIRAILDANRNSLMLLDLRFSVLTLGTTIGMFIAALYGMNLENFIEETNFGFAGISGLCVVLTGAACFWGMRRLRKVQRVRMWDDRTAMRDSSNRARQLRKVGLQRRTKEIANDRAERGLGETVAGIRSQEMMSNWKRVHQERLRKLEKSADNKAVASPPI